MYINQKLKQLLSWTFNPSETKLAEKYMTDETVLSHHAHIQLAADWLLKAQASNKDAGYSRKYSLLNHEWDDSYIETTGYIIPTLLRVSDYLQLPHYRESALRAGEWLLEVVDESGAFPDIDEGNLQVFDTGQCLFGLTALYHETKDERYYQAAEAASRWLVSQQDLDGAWRQYTFSKDARTYYSRVAAALIEFGLLSGNNDFVEAGVRNIQWVCRQQKKNGFFRLSEFMAGEKAFLHTMVYTIEGLLLAHHLLNWQDPLDAALRFAHRLKEINLHRDLILYSQYDQAYKATNKEKCLTGLAQWAGVCLDLYDITQDEAYLSLSTRTLYYLKSKQYKEGEHLTGGFPGSVPFYGKYGTLALPNWNNKFFIDTMLDYVSHHVSLDVEHETYVSACFSFDNDMVTTELVPMDELYLKMMAPVLEMDPAVKPRDDSAEVLSSRSGMDPAVKPRNDNAQGSPSAAQSQESNTVVLDLGCGRGKYLDYFAKAFPDFKLIGVDPGFASEDDRIVTGSANRIPLEDASVDIIVCIEVLQHVRFLPEALQEMKRVLKPHGKIVIGDRNPCSLLGYLKRTLEKVGRWMYPPDSPFKEKWFSSHEWKTQLQQAGFDVLAWHFLTSPSNPLPYLNRYYLMTCERADVS